MQVVKKVKNAVLYDNGCIRIDNIRGSYVHVDKPYKGKTDPADKEAKYSMVAILPKGTHADARALITDAIAAILKEKNKGAGVKSDAKFLRDGDDAAKPEYANAWTVNCSEARKPSARDGRGQLMQEEREIRDTFVSGYWFNILIRPWFQDNDFGKKVNAGFVGIQFVKRDDTFGDGVIDDSAAWDAVDEGGFGDDGL